MSKAPALKTTKTITSFLSFISTIEAQGSSGGKFWFRGVGNTTHSLIPFLFRHQNLKSDTDQFGRIERDLLIRFKQRSMAFHSKTFTTPWEWIFFMQHHGVPTRLLDWTENPFVALYFALKSTAHQSDAVVWMLDPVAWNRHTLRDQSFRDGVLSVDDSELSSYAPPAQLKDMKNFPVAIYGAHNSARIVAQRGVFMVFGRANKSMEAIAAIEKYPKHALIGLKIPKRDRAKILKGLLGYGFTESVVFPDLDGLANEMRREFGFN